MKAARFYGAKDIRVEEVLVSKTGKGEVKIEIEWCGICGSDMHEFIMGPMNATKLPVIMGHEMSGEIVEVGEGVSHLLVGDKVVVEPLLPCMDCESCKNGLYHICQNIGLVGLGHDAGFADYMVIRAKSVHKVPDSMPYEVAALVEPVAVVNHAVRQSQFKVGDSVAVFGAGPIGLLLISMLKAAGASHIFVVEISEARRKLAEQLGATLTIDPIQENAAEIIKSKTKGGVNVAYEVAGVQPTLEGAIASIKPRGQVQIIALWEKPASFIPTQMLLKEGRINTNFCYSNEVFPQVIEMLSRNLVNLEGIISKKIYLGDIVKEGFETLLYDKSQYKILVTPKMENLK